MGGIFSRTAQQGRDEEMPDGDGRGSADKDRAHMEGFLPYSADVSRNGNVIEARVESPPHIPEPQDESRRKRKRAANWNPDETLKLLESRLQPSTLDKGKSEWEAISKRIPGRTGQQCQQRWDTVVRPYKKIKSHCDAHGKDYSQVTEAEFRSMKLGNIDSVSYGDLFKRIDEYYSRKSGKGSMASSTAAIGENDLPSGAPDALPPKLVTAAYPVQQTKSTDFGAAALDAVEPRASTTSEAEDPALRDWLVELFPGSAVWEE